MEDIIQKYENYDEAIAAMSLEQQNELKSQMADILIDNYYTPAHIPVQTLYSQVRKNIKALGGKNNVK